MLEIIPNRYDVRVDSNTSEDGTVDIEVYRVGTEGGYETTDMSHTVASRTITIPDGMAYVDRWYDTGTLGWGDTSDLPSEVKDVINRLFESAGIDMATA